MKVAALAHAIGARLLGDGDLDVVAVRHVQEANAGDLAWVGSASERRWAVTTRAGAILVEEDFAAEHAHNMPCAVLCASPASTALVLAVRALHPPLPRSPDVHPSAVVHTDATLGVGVSIGPHAVVLRAVLGRGASIGALAFIGDGCRLGDDVVVGVGAVLLPGSRVGARSTIGPGTVVGDDGFVFSPRGADNDALPHLAHVDIGADVDIGANSCVDRGALRDTRIGDGARIDNLVQLGHDVQVGKHAVVVAQVGVAGDATLGDGVVLGGQAGVQEHTHIGRGARVSGKAGVTKNVADHAVVSGFPAMPHADWLHAMAHVRRLRTLEQRIGALERALAQAGVVGPPLRADKDEA